MGEGEAGLFTRPKEPVMKAKFYYRVHYRERLRVFAGIETLI